MTGGCELLHLASADILVDECELWRVDHRVVLADVHEEFFSGIMNITKADASLEINRMWKIRENTDDHSAELGADIVEQVLGFDAQEGLLPFEAAEIPRDKPNTEIVPTLRKTD